MKLGKITVALAAMIILAACGSQVTEDGRVISGEIVTDTSTSLAKSVGTQSGCVEDICGVRAYNMQGEGVEGEVDPSTNRWRVRVRAGNWMFAFLDGDGNRLGILSMNGITAVTVEDGGDIDLGPMRWQEGEMMRFMVMDRDRERLGLDGIYACRCGDADHDGIPGALDDDEPPIDLDTFDVLFIRPHDGALYVAPCRPILVVFTQELDEESVNLLVTYEDGQPVEGTLEILQDGLFFIPTEPFALGEIITVTVPGGDDGIRSAEGDVLADDLTIQFTVRELCDPDLSCHDPDREREREQLRQLNNEEAA